MADEEGIALDETKAKDEGTAPEEEEEEEEELRSDDEGMEPVEIEVVKKAGRARGVNAMVPV